MRFALKNDCVYVQITHREKEMEIIRSIPYSSYDKQAGFWKFPQCLASIEVLRKRLALPKSLEELRDSILKRADKIQFQREGKIETDFPLKPGIKLYEHQKRGAAMALTAFGAYGGYHPKHSGFGLLFEMGCGKTLTAIAVMGAMYNLKKIKRVLVVAPTSIIPVWADEIEKFGDFPCSIAPLQGEAKKRCKALSDLVTADGLQVAVINYESVWRTSAGNSIYKAVQDFDADMIICDESQRIKNPVSRQSKAMHRLGDVARYKLILSGTPMSNSPMDFWSQYRFMDSKVFGTNYYRYRDRYAVLGGFGGQRVVGIRNVDELKEKIHSMSLRVSKADALDLPEQVFIDRPCPLTAAEMQLYEKVKEECCAELDSIGATVTAEIVVVKLLRLQQITGGFAQPDGEEKPRQIGKTKLKVLEDILEDAVLGSGKKIVVFSRFKPEIDAITGLLKKMNIGYAAISGDVPIEQRGDAVKEFQNDDGCMVFVAQIDTAGLGITLTAADTAVYYSCNFSYAAYEQSLARTHRIGQRNKCTYIRLISPNTVDEKIYQALNDKKNLADLIVDGWQDIFR